MQLDLKQVKHYMGTTERSASHSGAMLDAPEGDIALIFSEQVGEAVLTSSTLLSAVKCHLAYLA